MGLSPYGLALGVFLILVAQTPAPVLVPAGTDFAGIAAVIAALTGLIAALGSLFIGLYQIRKRKDDSTEELIGQLIKKKLAKELLDELDDSEK